MILTKKEKKIIQMPPLRALEIALIVSGVVRQQPPIRDAPASCHILTKDTKSSSETPVDGCKYNKH